MKKIFMILAMMVVIFLFVACPYGKRGSQSVGVEVPNDTVTVVNDDLKMEVEAVVDSVKSE